VTQKNQVNCKNTSPKWNFNQEKLAKKIIARSSALIAMRNS